MWTAVLLAAASPLATLAYLVGSYTRALERSANAWWMGNHRGAAWLHFMFSRFPRSSMGRRVAAMGAERCEQLASAAPAPGAVFFVGSSTLTYWRHLEADMAAVGVAPVVNAAFGGSWTEHVLQRAEALCFHWAPSCVCYFCGTNDINVGFSARAAADNFIAFCERLEAACPSTPIIYLEPTVTPFVSARGEQRVAQFREASALVRAYAATRAAVTVVGTDGAFTEADWLGDDHHLNDAGHRRLAAVLGPVVAKATAARGTSKM